MRKSRSKIAKLYEKYKGYEAYCFGSRGIVVGHDKGHLIILVQSGMEIGWSYNLDHNKYINVPDELVSEDNGFLFISENSLIKPNGE